MRKQTIQRKTGETDIACTLNIDGSGAAAVQTGIGFFDHMLTLMAFHARWDLDLKARGDLQVDDHHTVEDTGIVLGQALRRLLGSVKGIQRYGSAVVPMDEVLCRTAVDCSGRAFCRVSARFAREEINGFAVENVNEFFQALCRESGICLHSDILAAGNTHHQAEAIFKSAGRALAQALAVTRKGRNTSTKQTGYEE